MQHCFWLQKKLELFQSIGQNNDKRKVVFFRKKKNIPLLFYVVGKNYLCNFMTCNKCVAIDIACVININCLTLETHLYILLCNTMEQSVNLLHHRSSSSESLIHSDHLPTCVQTNKHNRIALKWSGFIESFYSMTSLDFLCHNLFKVLVFVLYLTSNSKRR